MSQKQKVFFMIGLGVIASITQMTCDKVVQARNEVAQQQQQNANQSKDDVRVQVELGNDGVVYGNSIVNSITHVDMIDNVEDTPTTTPHEPALPSLLGDDRDNILYKIEQETGVEARILYAICMVESHCDSTAIGDNGNSYGAYQMFQKAHPNTIEIAKDFEQASRWTANYLLRNGYFNDKWRAAKCHNSCTAKNNYVQKVKRYYNF